MIQGEIKIGNGLHIEELRTRFGGKTAFVTLEIAEFYDDQVDAAVEGLTSIIEPIIIGFLGIVIGFIVIALFLPIINITQVL